MTVEGEMADETWLNPTEVKFTTEEEINTLRTALTIATLYIDPVAKATIQKWLRDTARRRVS